MGSKHIPDKSDGFFIALSAVTACYIFKECLKKVNITGESVDVTFKPRELREAIENEIKDDDSVFTAKISRDKYLRDRYREIKVMLEAGDPFRTKQFNYRNFLPLMKFAGVADFYAELDHAFRQQTKTAGFSLKLPRIRFQVDKESFKKKTNDNPPKKPDPDLPVAEPLLLYNIPTKPAYFIGRAEKLRQIHQKLAGEGHSQNILLLNGIGGMGKTTLMQAYLHQDGCREYFDRIIFSAVNKDLAGAFISAASLALGLEEERRRIHAIEEQLVLVRNALAKFSGLNLFVLDNVNESDFDDLRSLKRVFEATGWKFLVTTRTVPDGFGSLDVDELELRDAKFLFTYHYTRDNPGFLTQQQLDEEVTRALTTIDPGNELEALLGHIFRHTLLTELLAKSGRKKGLSLKQLLEKLKEADFRHPDLQRAIETGSHTDSTFRRQLHVDTLHLYMLSLFDTEYLTTATGDEAADTEHKAKTAMLRFFSVLPADDIPLTDLQALWRVDEPGEIAFENRLDELRQIGWIQGKQDIRHIGSGLYEIYKMHPLVQEVVYEKLTPDIENCLPLVITVKEILIQPKAYPQPFQTYAQAILDNLEGLEAAL